MEQEEGPGLKATDGRIDPVSTTSIIFAVLGLIPTGAFRLTLGAEALGPIAFPAIFAVVGVLFGLITLIRHQELQNQLALKIGSVGLALGLIRLFIYPFAGW